MRRLQVEAKAVTVFGTIGVTASALARVDDVEGAAVDVVAFEPGALLGRHPTPLWQLFAVLSGSGWAAGADGIRAPLTAGDVVLWEPGENHETGTGGGMIAVVVQTPVPPLPRVRDRHRDGDRQ